MLSRFDASVGLSDPYAEMAPDLSPPDRDLAIRLLNRPPEVPWWALELHGATTVRDDGFGGRTLTRCLRDPIERRFDSGPLGWQNDPADDL